jgi:hypothetical protein
MLDTDKTKLHDLVEALPKSEVVAAQRFLEFLINKAARDPVLQAFLDAPEDDEPVTEEDLRDIEQGKRAIARGETESLEDVMREFGI